MSDILSIDPNDADGLIKTGLEFHRLGPALRKELNILKVLLLAVLLPPVLAVLALTVFLVVTQLREDPSEDDITTP